ncbi:MULTISPECIES: hypothetical protein [unclassified Streptomyces]|jgi:DnaJ-class molecular chaperone|uniref:hypothetical protein n=1 Tax=unclassified Streptomyces TaxID=2593676 RepID=UPI00367F25AE
MMPHSPTTRVCSHCDGFPVVHVTTGTTAPDGRRRTLTATCPACRGLGHTVRTTLVRAGK